jgi:hypothetical protein
MTETVMKKAKYFLCGLALAILIPVLTQAEEAKVKPYPLKVCLITGEKIGTEGMTPVTITNQNQEIKFCCGGCVKTFKKDPEKYMKKLQEEEKKLKDAEAKAAKKEK